MEHHSGLARKNFRLFDQRFSLNSQTLPERLIAEILRTYGQERLFLDYLREVEHLCHSDSLCSIIWWVGHALIDLRWGENLQQNDSGCLLEYDRRLLGRCQTHDGVSELRLYGEIEGGREAAHTESYTGIVDSEALKIVKVIMTRRKK
jgi:hypothetical protein